MKLIAASVFAKMPKERVYKGTISPGQSPEEAVKQAATNLGVEPLEYTYVLEHVEKKPLIARLPVARVRRGGTFWFRADR